MNRLSKFFLVTLTCVIAVASGATNGDAQNKNLLELEKKMEKAKTPEKREAIAHMRDLFIKYQSNYSAMKIAGFILEADRNISVLAKLADYAISPVPGTQIYISLAEQAAKASLADQEFLQLAEFLKKRDSGGTFILELAKEAARAKTENERIKAQDRITALVTGTKTIVYDENKMNPYVSYLKSNAQPPVDYILDLFTKYDIVIIAERTHTETTQWDFIYELTCDPRFMEKVGNIFTEYGSVVQQPELEKFMATPLSPEERDKAAIHLLQNFPVWPAGWDNNNIYDYLRKLQTLNQRLEPQKRISLYFSDIPWKWEGKTREEYIQRQKTDALRRDEIMAENITKKFRDIQASDSPRKKALVVMNTRHGFGALYHKGKMFENTGGYLMKAFPGKVANVMMNYHASDIVKLLPPGRILIGKISHLFRNNDSGNDKRSDTVLKISKADGYIIEDRMTRDGVWDAAFWLMGNKPIGFTFKESPFGKDTFDCLAPKYSMFKYEDVFTGMVFYQPLDQHMQENYIPGYFDDGFDLVLLERSKLLGEEYVNNMRRLIDSRGKMGGRSNKTKEYGMKFVFKPASPVVTHEK